MGIISMEKSNPALLLQYVTLTSLITLEIKLFETHSEELPLKRNYNIKDVVGQKELDM